MSDPVIKGVKRPSSRQASHKDSPASSVKSRKLRDSSARPKQIVKRSSSEKAPVRNATPSKTTSAKTGSKAARPAKTKTVSQTKATPAKARRAAGAPSSVLKKTASRAAPTAKGAKKQQRPAASAPKARPTKPSGVSSKLATVSHASAARQPTRDEAAALRAFERAHREFARGRFAEARTLFRTLIEQHGGVAEVTARARTYLAIIETRLRTENALPRDAESLYDRGVIELNRAEYVAAQEMFERALKREPQAAHIHYSLAATRARLGAIDSALESLERALDLQPVLRVRAQHDQDLAVLRNEPDFERLIFPVSRP